MNNHHVYQYHLNLFNQSNQQEIEHYIDADMELCAQEQYIRDLLDSLPLQVSYYSFYTSPLDFVPFALDNLDDFIYQMKRTHNTDLKYPIIIDDKGTVADGYHRIAKAIFEGRTTIKAYRLKYMPSADKEEQK